MSIPIALPWQRNQVERFLAARQAGHVAHAMLLTGPQGVGKRRFAEVIAAALFCEQPTGAGAACGLCRSCVLFAAGSHPDWSLLRPEEDKRDIAIEAVRELCERLSMSSQLRRAKVACFDPADTLNTSGINALLKTIEEPPPDTYLLLLSARSQSLPPTLRSRCQRLDFPLPTVADSGQWLAQQHPQVDAAQRATALKLAFGAPLTAGALIESGGIERNFAWRSILAELASGKVDPLQAAARVGKDEAPAFVRWLLLDLNERLRAQLLAAAAASPAANPAAGGIERLRQGCVETLRNLAGNANPQLALESLLIVWRSLSVRRSETA